MIPDEKQEEAIAKCCDIKNRIVAVTGEAGTGKTTILRKVFDRLQSSHCDVVLCAPTGKAAKRITEATGIEAQTIHRLLEYPKPGMDPDTGKPLITTEPKRDRKFPLEQKVVLCDEYAMVNTEVHRNLLDALPAGGCIRMFGDANQLQPIESNKRLQSLPSPFLQILDKFNSVVLESIHRQGEGSSIIENGHRIIKGNMPVRRDDFALLMTRDNPVQDIQDFIMDNLHDHDVDFGSIENQLITPTKIGWVGTLALNGAIQLLLQPSSNDQIEVERQKWDEREFVTFYQGDKVIFMVNNYGLEIFNGETGIITAIQADGGIVVNFGDKDVTIPVSQEIQANDGIYYINPQKDLELAYTITTHKSQGSEYKRVGYIMNSSRSFLLNRKNFYTGISRAREHVTVITDQKAIVTSLNKKGDK